MAKKNYSSYNKQNKGNSDSNKQKKDCAVNSYVGAPYNFIPLPKKINEKKYQDIIPQNAMPSRTDSAEGKLYSGSITYTITAQNDIFIGGRNGNSFYCDAGGNYAIPSSSMRGLVRENMQILGLGTIADDVYGDYLMTYRKVGGPVSKNRTDGEKIHTIKDDYNNSLGSRTKKIGKAVISIRKEVSAGILYNDGKKYYILPTEGSALNDSELGKQNYYILRENDIIKDLRDKGKQSSYAYLETDNKNVLMHLYKEKYPFLEKGNVEKGCVNRNYCPSILEISFKVGPNQNVVAVAASGALKGKNCYEGYLLSSGHMAKKKAHYVIRKEKDNCQDQWIHVDKKYIDSYKIDYQARADLLGTTQNKNDKKVLAAYRELFALPEEGKKKPVFFVKPDSSDELYFGFTPNLRLFYKHSINDGIPESHKKKIDYVKSILGYTSKDDNTARRSRVSFGDAGLISDGEVKPVQNFILGEPKPTSFYDYLTQKDGEEVSYNLEEFEIRGYKQYWLHESEKLSDIKNGDSKTISSFSPLGKGCQFEGIVHFHNLKEDELGLLLWSIRLNKDSEQNIGKAKAQGYGRIKVDITNLMILDYKKMYLSSSLDFAPYQNGDITGQVDAFIQSYIAIASKSYKTNITETETIRQFFIMKESFPVEDNIRYMELGKKEYQDREKKNIDERRLPTPEEVLKQNVAVEKSTNKQVKTTGNEIRKKEIELKVGQIYEAVFIKVESPKVKFKLADGIYPTIRLNRLPIEGINKKNVGNYLEIGKTYNLKYVDDKVWDLIL